MKEITLPNDPAFARPSFEGHRIENNDQDGLTKREYFAAAALQGILANSYYNLGKGEMAAEAVKLADDLIERLNQDQQ